MLKIINSILFNSSSDYDLIYIYILKLLIVGNLMHKKSLLKNNILSKYNIPLIRLTTNGSREENIIRSKLDETVNNKQLYNIKVIAIY